MPSRRSILTLTLLVGSQLWAPGFAAAQTTPPADQAPAAAPAPTPTPDTATTPPAGTPDVTVTAPKSKMGEEIVVTGSRIRRKDLTTPAPVTVLSRDQVMASGKVTLGEFLQTMPEQGGALNPTFNNGGDGSTQISLRNLGSNRTLVLVDGRRMAGYFVANAGSGFLAVDLNSIPTAAIERIEVLKDGASAVYGSDAIAGVVNIILRKNFSGTEASAYAGTSQHGGGTTYDFSVTSGITGEKGSAIFSAEYFTQGHVYAGQRDWTSTIYGLDYTTGEKTPGGSSAIPAGRFRLDPSTCSTPACIALQNAGYTSATNFFADPSLPGGGRKYNAATDTYNFELANYIYTPQDRISLFSAGNAALPLNARAYYEASFVNRQSVQALAPEPLFTSDHDISLSKNSIYNPYGVDLPDVRRRLVEFGNRRFSQDIDTIRIVTGLDGTLPSSAGPLANWFWDLALNYSRTSGVNMNSGYFRAPLLANTLGPSMMVNGVPTCVTSPGDATTAIPGCVPLNPLGANTITPDQIRYLGLTGIDRLAWQMTQVQFNTTGELFTIPTADRPVGLAAGYEFRREVGSFQPNPISAAGEQSESNSVATSGGFNAHEGYAELSIPIVTKMPGAEVIEGTAAARVFNYSTFGTDYTYKFGLRWQPVRDATLRGTHSTAYRAPSIVELYQGAADNFPTVSDPCSGLDANGNPAPIDPNSTLGKRCGAAINNGDDRSQLRSKNGGNTLAPAGTPKLQPETAKIWTAGVVLEPHWVKNLTFTIDYYNIEITRSISTLSAAIILQSCYQAQTAQFCDLIHRNAGTGLVSTIDDYTRNLQGDKTSGIDLAGRYTLPTADFGRFAFLFDGTYLINYDRTLPTGTVIKAAGTYDIYALPKLKFNAGARWGMGGFGAGINMQFIGTFTECANGSGTSGSDGLCYLLPERNSKNSRTVDAWQKWDAFVSYTLPWAGGKTSLQGGVQNVFDTNPPLVYNNGTYASDPSTYDFMGRYFYARLTHQL